MTNQTPEELTMITISAQRVADAEAWRDRAIERIRAAVKRQTGVGVVGTEHLMASYGYKLEHEAILRCIAIVCEECRNHVHGGESCVKAKDLWDLLTSMES